MRMRKHNLNSNYHRSIADKFCHTFYRILISKNRDSLRCSVNRDEYREIQRELFRTIADEYVNNDSGVFISNLGYLCHIIKPERKVSISKNTGGILRSATNGYLYRHVCLDFFPRGQFYHLSTNLSSTLKVRCKARSRKGFVYKFNFREVKSFIANFVKKPRAIKLK